MLRLNVSNPELFETRTFPQDSQTKRIRHENETFFRKTTCLYRGRYPTCCLAPFCISDLTSKNLSSLGTSNLQKYRLQARNAISGQTKHRMTSVCPV